MYKVIGHENIYSGIENGEEYIIGQVGALIKAKYLKWSDYDRDLWCFLPNYRKAWYGKTIEEVIEHMHRELA
jgi:hypothetical protein